MKLLLMYFIVLTSINNTYACLNLYAVDEHGEQHSLQNSWFKPNTCFYNNHFVQLKEAEKSLKKS